MRILHYIIPLLFSVLFVTQANAALLCSNYVVIIDAGSSGSRVHLFHYDDNKNLPGINDVYIKKNVVPLASFSKNPSKAGESLQPLLDGVTAELRANGIHFPITIHVLGTAGMRLLSTAEQTEIYNNVRNYIEHHYKDSLISSDLQTLPGKVEALYNWLDVNYKAKNFQNNITPVGTLDMGNASTQIAFVTDNTDQTVDEVLIKVNGIHYNVYVKSFLGLGLDQARLSMNRSPDSMYCYAQGAPYHSENVGNFNFENCRLVYKDLIKNHHVSEKVPSVEKIGTFVAFSGAYYTYQFFGVGQTPPPKEMLEQQYIAPICNNNWNQLKIKYPNESDQYLMNYCANGIYITELFFDAYKIQNTQLKVISQINQQGIDWTLGAMLYYLINPTCGAKDCLVSGSE